MVLIARWLVKLIPFSDYGYLIPPRYENQENGKIAEKFLRSNVTLRTVHLNSTKTVNLHVFFFFFFVVDCSFNGSGLSFLDGSSFA